ncbi:MAG: ankyrin repeat domain-containing protein [Aliarcobacter sp.]|nr:ankyrin repeat domain-containing protein [Aliarcobacter sp.]
MFKNIFNKTAHNQEELVKELLNPSFNLAKVNKIISSINIDLNTLFYEDELVFHLCCKKDLFQAVLWFLDNKINIEIENNQKETAIFYAIHSKSTGILQVLLESKININHLNIYNRTALQDAVIGANSNRVVNYLLQVTSNISNCDIHGNNLIFDAIANGSFELIKKIAALDEIDINQVNEEGHTILHKESVLRNSPLAIALMELGANPTIWDKNGNSFLFNIISKGIDSLEIIEKAIRLKYDINIKNSQNKTLLMECISYFLNTPYENEQLRLSYLEMSKELMRLGVNVDSVDNKNENAFFLVTRSENKELINIFLENCNVNLDHKNINDETVLSILVLNGIRNIDFIKLYLQKGANPNIQDKTGKTIIEILINIILHSENRKELDFEYEILLNKDAEYPTVLEVILSTSNIDLNNFNSKGEPLFFDSILHFNFKLFKLLKIKNINLNQKDKDGNNIIFKLMEYNYKNLIKDKKLYLNTIKSLINSGVDINAKNKEGLTALHIAVGEKCEYTLRLLLEMRADCNATDNKGHTIMHTCIWKNTSNYFNLIHQYNKEIINTPDFFGIRPINYAAFMGKKDLVIKMLNTGALVNNSNKKDPKILHFLEKFHSNVINLPNNIEKSVDQNNLNFLANNMIKEFDIKI